MTDIAENKLEKKIQDMEFVGIVDTDSKTKTKIILSDPADRSSNVEILFNTLVDRRDLVKALKEVNEKTITEAWAILVSKFNKEDKQNENNERTYNE